VKLRYEHPNDADDVRVVSVPMHDSIRSGTLRSTAEQCGDNDFDAWCRWVDRCRWVVSMSWCWATVIDGNPEWRGYQPAHDRRPCTTLDTTPRRLAMMGMLDRSGRYPSDRLANVLLTH